MAAKLLGISYDELVASMSVSVQDIDFCFDTTQNTDSSCETHTVENHPADLAKHGTTMDEAYRKQIYCPAGKCPLWGEMHKVGFHDKEKRHHRH
eukprot:12739432-Ditylum_brightwellii.AAC.1